MSKPNYTSTKAVVIEGYGDSSVLSWQEISLDSPAPHEVQIEHKAIGLNFIDIYQRNGLYPLPLPLILGSEGAGVVIECGEKIDNLEVGDLVTYGNSIGAYCQVRNIAADKLIKVPDQISAETAATLMLRGMTAEYLLHRTFSLEKNHKVLWHAAAGGLSKIAIPWMKSIGAFVIGCVGAKNKMDTAYKYGCDQVIIENPEFSNDVREIVSQGVDVVYDSVGASTFDQSLKSLKRRGMMVSFGNASGPVSGVNLGILATNGSLFLTRPSLIDYTSTRDELELSSSRLFSFLSSHPEIMTIDQRFSLQDIETAHKALEGRKTTGFTVLIP